MMGFLLNMNPEAIPVFYVNKQIWNEEYQSFIAKHVIKRNICIVVDADESWELPNRYVEFYFDCLARFNEYKAQITKFCNKK